MKSILRAFRHGQRGFTLIELLVVVAILGILAAVIIPNVMGMIGTGRVEAANTEAHDVEIAVLAAMVDNDAYELTDEGIIGPGHTSAVTSSTDVVLVIEDFFTGNLEAIYTLDTAGHIVSADAVATGKWAGLGYTENVGWTETTTTTP